MEFRRKLNQLPHEYTAYEHLSDLVNQTLCPKQDDKDYHESNCLLRKCDKCGINGFKILDEENDMGEMHLWQNSASLNMSLLVSMITIQRKRN